MKVDTDIIGLHYGMSREDYDSLPAVGQSVIKRVLKSPQHCKWFQEHPETSDALTIGSAFHALVIDIGKFKDEFVVWPGRRAGKYWERFKAEETRKILRHQDYLCAKSMADSVQAHPDSARIFARGPETECVAVWKDEPTGLMLKARIDALICDEWPTVADLKSTIDASPAAFSRSIHRYGYAEQAAMYVDGVKQFIKGMDTHVDPNFVIVAVEKEPPYAVGVYPLGLPTIEMGRRRMGRAIDLYAKCMESGEWPGYPMADLDVSEWTLKEEGI